SVITKEDRSAFRLSGPHPSFLLAHTPGPLNPKLTLGSAERELWVSRGVVTGYFSSTYGLVFYCSFDFANPWIGRTLFLLVRQYFFLRGLFCTSCPIVPLDLPSYTGTSFEEVFL